MIDWLIDWKLLRHIKKIRGNFKLEKSDKPEPENSIHFLHSKLHTFYKLTLLSLPQYLNVIFLVSFYLLHYSITHEKKESLKLLDRNKQFNTELFQYNESCTKIVLVLSTDLTKVISCINPCSAFICFLQRSSSKIRLNIVQTLKQTV